MLNIRDAVEWRGVRDDTEYYVDGSPIITISGSTQPADAQPHSGAGAGSDPLADKPGAVDTIGAFFRILGQLTYCPCGDPDGKRFECRCGDARYGDDLDGGLDEEAARRFLYGIPAGIHDRLLPLVRSFDGFRYAMRGRAGPCTGRV